MSTIPKRAVVHNTTGAIIKSGRTDFTGQFNPVDFTQYVLSDSAEFVEGVPYYYHKVVGADIVEMSAGEKTAVDVFLDAKKTEELRFITVVAKIVPNLAALPTPPPKAGVLVGVESIAGTPGFVISTNTNYIVFQSDGVHP